MPQLSIANISILLEATASKAGVSDFDSGGFIKVAEFLENCPSDFGVSLSDRYLKEQLYDKITKAKKKGQTAIGLSLAYADTLSQALDFKSFKGFERHLDKLKKSLNGKKGEISASPKFIVGNDQDIKQFSKIKNVLDAFEQPIKLIPFSSIENLQKELPKDALVFLENSISNKNLKLSEIEIIKFELQKNDTHTPPIPSTEFILDYNGVLIAISSLNNLNYKNQKVIKTVEVDDPSTETLDNPLKNPLGFAVKNSFWIGLIITFFLFLSIFIIPCPTSNQQLFFRVILALGVASITSKLPQFLHLKIPRIDKINIGFTGFLVFLLIYFVNPQSIVFKNYCDTMVLHGKIMYKDQPLRKAFVSIRQLDKHDITSYNGSFDLSFEKQPQFPLTFSIRFGSIDTILELPKWPKNNEIMIHLEDTISELTESVINKLIESHLKFFTQGFLADHNTELRKSKKADTSFNNLITSYESFEKLDTKGHRNPMHFTNGFKALITQKSIRAAGIRIEPMNPYQSYEMSHSHTYIYEDKTWKEAAIHSKKMRFVLINKNPILFSVKEIDRINNDSYQVSVHFSENIRLVKTEVECSPHTDGMKVQKTSYKGMKPIEKFLFQFKNNEWSLADVIE